MLEPGAPGFAGFSEAQYYGHGMFYKYCLLGHGGQTLGFQRNVGYLSDEDVNVMIWKQR